MKARIESEVKIFGINFFIVSAAFTVAMIVLSIIAGDLLDFYPVSFEVIFPFLLQSLLVNGERQEPTVILMLLPHKANLFSNGYCYVT